jgi:hypothetical protein
MLLMLSLFFTLSEESGNSNSSYCLESGDPEGDSVVYQRCNASGESEGRVEPVGLSQSAPAVTILVTPAYVQNAEDEADYKDDAPVNGSGEDDDVNGDYDNEENPLEDDKEWTLKPAHSRAARGRRDQKTARCKKRRVATSSSADASAALSPSLTRWSECRYCGKVVRAPYIHVFREYFNTE